MLYKFIMLAGVLLFFFLADVVFGNSNLAANVKSGLLVVGGPFLAIFLSYQLQVIKSLGRRVVKMFREEGEAREFVLINEIEEMANAWHAGGHRQLEKAARRTASPLLRTGAGMIADGYKAGEIRKILSRQCRLYFADRAVEGEVLLALGKLTMTFGIIGTIVGVIRALGAIGDATAIANGMAIALLSSLYGLLLANFVYMPLHKKFEAHLSDEHKGNALIMEGVNCLVLGHSSRAISYRLNSFLGGEYKPAPRENQIFAVPHPHSGMISRAA